MVQLIMFLDSCYQNNNSNYLACWYLSMLIIWVLSHSGDFCNYPDTVEVNGILYVVFKAQFLTSIHSTNRLFTYNLICLRSCI